MTTDVEHPARRVVVVGGGLAGLTVALRRATAGDMVMLLEASARLGGQLWTERRDGFVVEHGAEGFVARSEAVPALASDLGIADDLIGQSESRSYGFDGGALVPLAPGEAAAFLGFQVPKDELGKGIRAFRLGMGELAEALAARLTGPLADHVEVRLGVRATRIEPLASGARVVLDGSVGARPATVDADAIVVATTAATAAPLLEGALGATATALAEAQTLSSCTVTLAYPRDAIDHPLDGTGFVVAAAHQQHGFRAATFITSKFERRAPEGVASIRIFFRPSVADLATLTEAAWTARAEESLARVLGVRGAPIRAWVSRWSAALPVFEPGHVSRVRALESALAGTHVHLAGAAFHGSGIDAAVRSAEAAAAAIPG
jgi:oxygen-dependent protoporphyrinogen oxidase